MRRGSEVRQSVAVSVLLMVLLFTLPLAVIVPFRAELFGHEKAADETEEVPFAPGDHDGAVALKVLDGETVR